LYSILSNIGLRQNLSLLQALNIISNPILSLTVSNIALSYSSARGVFPEAFVLSFTTFNDRKCTSILNKTGKLFSIIFVLREPNAIFYVDTNDAAIIIQQKSVHEEVYWYFSSVFY
jgi:hypothetical protein